MLSLKKGINFGGWFSQCKIDEDHYENFLSEKDVEWVSKNGFDHIRLPVDYEFFDNPSHYEKLDEFFSWCKKYSLCAILDLHKAPGYDFNMAGTDSKKEWLPLFKYKAVQDQFISLWVTLVNRYGKYDFVAFELLNEVVDEKYIRPWNRLIKKTVKAIRKVNEDCTIIYGGALWNSAKTVSKLKKPFSKNIMLTFHYYEPLLFTHQKAYWVKNMNPDLSIEYPQTTEWYKENSLPLGLQGKAILDYTKLTVGKDFHKEFIQEALDTAKKYGVPIYCGEFGVIDRAPEDSTCRWFSDVIDVFKESGIGYSLWNYKELDFGIQGEHYSSLIDVLTSK